MADSVFVVRNRDISWDPWQIFAAFTTLEKAEECIDTWKNKEEKGGVWDIEEVDLDPWAWPSPGVNHGGGPGPD